MQYRFLGPGMATNYQVAVLTLNFAPEASIDLEPTALLGYFYVRFSKNPCPYGNKGDN
jgi:hypothetical protein